MTKFYQELIKLLGVMTFNVDTKMRKITVFFMFFKIQMASILESKYLGEKIFRFPRVVFVILDFEEGGQEIFKK